jgi:hypothetical protein
VIHPVEKKMGRLGTVITIMLIQTQLSLQMLHVYTIAIAGNASSWRETWGYIRHVATT